MLEKVPNLKEPLFNVVAAPGSGKTVLGLGVVRELGKPALILAPTRAIREQWAERLRQHFLPVGTKRSPDWVSQDLKKPGWVTIATYQALYGLATQEVDEDGAGPLQSKSNLEVIRRLKRAGIGTLVLDEAHHLRGSWWTVLTQLKEGLGKPFVLSLTGTPPYDVPEHEWHRFERLCGPISAEISIPEMVREKNLCAHQDFALLCQPLAEEGKKLQSLRLEAAQLQEDLLKDHALGLALLKHPWVAEAKRNEEALLEDADTACAYLVYLNALGAGDEPGPRALHKILNAPFRVPRFDLPWAERLLQGVLSPKGLQAQEPALVRRLSVRLRAMGALDRGLVNLRQQPGAAKLLASSGAKLGLVQELVDFEWKSLGKDLRMVVLSDFVGLEDLELGSDAKSQHLSMGGIFRALAAKNVKGLKLAAVSGQGCVLPASEAAWMKAQRLRPQAIPALPGYLRAEMGMESSGKLLGQLTARFEAGSFHALVGTRALLGEGWDAPFVNALVLATWVKASMSSNQMRGRAIRIDRKDPAKVANVWHLACVEVGREGRGEEYQTLRRRFRNFVGLPANGPGLENGLARLGLGDWALAPKDVNDLNADTLRAATDRRSIFQRWQNALRGHERARIREAVGTSKPQTPRLALARYTGAALAVQGYAAGSFWGLRYLFEHYQAIGAFMEGGPATVCYMALAATFVGMGLRVSKGAWLLLRHGSPGQSLKQMGKAVLMTLKDLDHIPRKADAWVVVRRESSGALSVGVEGLEAREEHLFCQAMQELLDPVGDPRYLVVRKGVLWGLAQEDRHAVPSIFAGRKEDALAFEKQWGRYVCPGKIIYTRRARGRRLLLRARWDSLAGAAKGNAPSEPKVVWA